MAASKGTDVPVKDLKMIVVGEIKVDKSSSGNALLGGEVFRVESNLSSGTKQSDTVVTVVYTPGISNADQRNDAVKNAIETYHEFRNKKPNVVLIMMKPGSFSKEDKEAVKKVEDLFGKDVWERVVSFDILGDEVADDFDDKLIYTKKIEDPEEDKTVIHVAGRRFY